MRFSKMSDNKEAEQLTFDLDLADSNKEFTVNISGDDYSTGVYTSDNLWNGATTTSITLDTLDTDYLTDTGSEHTFNTTFEEFEDTMPSISKIKGMCEQYPAFQKEFEKFRQMYNLMKDDYEANNEDELSF
jgi:hypothetical protein|tara:strand:+ start:9849 stop:10241 length:393 start_codon:yes stop_codon:yes gene_type:complete